MGRSPVGAETTRKGRVPAVSQGFVVEARARNIPYAALPAFKKPDYHAPPLHERKRYASSVVGFGPIFFGWGDAYGVGLDGTLYRLRTDATLFGAKEPTAIEPEDHSHTDYNDQTTRLSERLVDYLRGYR